MLTDGFEHGFALITPVAKIMERVKDALDEPDLIGFGVERPCSAQDDDLDFVGGMTNVAIRQQAIIGLQVRIEAVLLRALCARLVRQVALGHAHIIGAKDARARAREGLGQDRDGGHATLATDGLTTDARGNLWVVWGELALLCQLLPRADQLTPPVKAHPVFGIFAQEAIKVGAVDAVILNDARQNGNIVCLIAS